MRWRAASTSARSGTGDAVMARVYHGPPRAMSQPAMARPCQRSGPTAPQAATTNNHQSPARSGAHSRRCGGRLGCGESSGQGADATYLNSRMELRAGQRHVPWLKTIPPPEHPVAAKLWTPGERQLPAVVGTHNAQVCARIVNGLLWATTGGGGGLNRAARP